MDSPRPTDREIDPGETPQRPPSPTFTDTVIIPSVEDQDNGTRNGAAQPEVSSPLSSPPEDRIPNDTEGTDGASEAKPKTPMRLPTRHKTPKSSLPPWKYISPRLTNEFARPPSAMAHRAHTPVAGTPPRPATPTPEEDKLLNEHGLHGETTYTSMPLEQFVLDPNDREDAEILEFSDDMPMGGFFLWNAKHKVGVRDQVLVNEFYFPDDFHQTSQICEKLWEKRLELSQAKWAIKFARQNINISPQFRSSWHAKDEGQAVVRSGRGKTTYWSQDSPNSNGQKNNPKKPKKQHKRFTSPVEPSIENEVQRYVKALSNQYPDSTPESPSSPPEIPAIDLDPPLSQQPPPSPRPKPATLEMGPPPARKLPQYQPPSAPPQPKVKIIAWKIYKCRSLLYHCRLEGTEAASL